jgi:hypothetical protein
MTPVISTPLQCPRCGGVFLPPTLEPTAVIECPHCAHRLRVTEWGRSRLAAAGPGRWRTWVAAAAGVVMLAGAAWVISRIGRVQRPEIVPGETRADAGSTEGGIDEAFATARGALGSANWGAALPLIRHAARVRPLMERYHAIRPWTPVVLTGTREGRITGDGPHRRAIISCNTEKGRIIEVQLEASDTGWKLDWEELTNARGFEWDEFYARPPAEPRRLRVSALRASVPDEYYSKAGQDRSGTVAVRFFGGDRGDSVVALVPKASEIGRLFQVELSWEVPRSYVCELRSADPAAVPPRVELTEFVQKGWDLDEGT